MNPLNLGGIGAGRMGKSHAENIATRIRGASLAGVADLNLAAAQEVSSQFHVPLATADYRELLTAPHIGAVAICSATDTHAQIIQEDRKSTRLNSSHQIISYAVFCLKKKKQNV